MTMRPDNRWLGALAVLAALGVATAAAAADAIKVAVSQRGAWDSVFVFTADKQGFYKELGLEPTFTFTAGGSETVQALTTGSVDIATPTSMHAALAAYAKGAPVRIIASQMVGSPDIYWYVKADSPIRKPADMAGKQVGYSRTASVSHMIVLSFVNANKIDAKLVQTGSTTSARTQLMTGQIDVGWSAVPTGLDLVRSGQVRILFTGDDAKDLADVTSRCALAGVEFLKSKRDIARRFETAHARAVEWVYGGHLREAAQIFADENKIDVETAMEATKFFAKERHAPAPIHGIEAAARQALEFGLIKEPLTPAQLAEVVDIVYDPRQK
jgi:NitT/TauT family transport system substrate-binding protein